MEISDTLTLGIMILLISLKPFKETHSAIAKVVNLEDHMISENVPNIDIDKNTQYQFVFKNRNSTLQDYDRCDLILKMQGIYYEKDKIVIRVNLEPTDTCAYSLSLFIGKSATENIPIVTLSCNNITDWEGHFPTSYVFVQFRRIKNNNISDDVLGEINASISFTTCKSCYKIPEYFDKNIVQLSNHCDQSEFCLDNKPEVYYGGVSMTTCPHCQLYYEGESMKTCPHCQLTFDVQEPVEICFRAHSVMGFFSDVYCQIRLLLGEKRTLRFRPVYQTWCLPKDLIGKQIKFEFGNRNDRLCRYFWEFCSLEIKTNTTARNSQICSQIKEKIATTPSNDEWSPSTSKVNWSPWTSSPDYKDDDDDDDEYSEDIGLIAIIAVAIFIVCCMSWRCLKSRNVCDGESEYDTSDVNTRDEPDYIHRTRRSIDQEQFIDNRTGSVRRNNINRGHILSSFSERDFDTLPGQEEEFLPPPYPQENCSILSIPIAYENDTSNSILQNPPTNQNYYTLDPLRDNDTPSDEINDRQPPPSYDEACKYYMQ